MKPRILIVEENPDLLRPLKQLISDLDLEGIFQAPGVLLRDSIDLDTFDGIFLDLKTAERKGSALVERIRGSKANSHTPVLMLTATRNPKDLKECFRLGIDLFLEKPVDPGRLRRLLRTCRGMISRERRRYRRFPIPLPVLCRWDLQDISGQIIDLSATGMIARLEKAPPVGFCVRLQFNLSVAGEPYAPTARVARITPDRHVAFQFVEVPPEARFRLMDLMELTSGEAVHATA